MLFFAAVVSGAVFFWLWNAHPTSFIGQVEVLQANVNTPDAGLLTNLWVAPLQEVKAGDLIAEMVTTDPRTVNNRLEVMRDRMRLTELELSPVLSRQRSALDYEQLAVTCARVRAELATAKVNLFQASNELRRITDLYQQKDRLVSETDFDLAKARFEALQTEVEEKTKIVTTTEKSLERLSYMADAYVPGGENDPLKHALSMEEAKIKVFEQKMKPLQLLAPIDGVVTLIHHRPGEQLAAGAAIVSITSKHSERIVGFVPRGFPCTPKVGTPVEVRTRELFRRKYLAQVIGIGPFLEPVTNSVLASPLAVRPVFIPATGQPIAVSLPPELRLLPGEYVDLSFAR